MMILTSGTQSPDILYATTSFKYVQKLLDLTNYNYYVHQLDCT